MQIGPMESELAGVLVFTHLTAILLTALWCSARARWQRGRGLARRPDLVETENWDRMRKAKAERAQGWREMGRATLHLLMATAFLLAVSILLGGTVKW